MPKDQVSDLITDQEMAFARLVLSGTMNDREAAQQVGLNPDTAAYTKSKPRVRAYMLEHRAAVQQQLVEQQAEQQRRLNQRREQILDRLLELANMSPDMTRGSITTQFKAISMIVAMEGLIPDCRAGSSASPQRAAPAQSTLSPDQAQIYAAAWIAKQQEKAIDPDTSPAIAEEHESGLPEPEPAPVSAEDEPPLSGITPATTFGASESSETTPSAPYAPPHDSAPAARVPFSMKKRRWRR